MLKLFLLRIYSEEKKFVSQSNTILVPKLTQSTHSAGLSLARPASPLPLQVT
jgi:hypothetical protein